MSMIQFVTVFAAVLTLTIAAPYYNIFRTNISPEEAQQYINNPPFTEPLLAQRTGVQPLVRYDSPQFRYSDAGPTRGRYWKNGRQIQNTDDYVEEVHNTQQFHGQDGLGAYAYGYKTPQSAKVENRARSGTVNGAYSYKDGNNELVKVRYWADNMGFHQEDNLANIALKQESQEHRYARRAHEKAWQEAAYGTSQQPDSQGEYSESPYQQGADQNYQYQGSSSRNYNNQPSDFEYQGSASETQGFSAPNRREGKAYSSNQGGFGQQRQYGRQKSQQQYDQQQSEYDQQQREDDGPHSGFFYSFGYPVSTIVSKDEQGQNEVINPSQPIDHDGGQRYG